MNLIPISQDIINKLKACKPESSLDIFSDSDPASFVNFDEIMMANLIIGSGRRDVTIIKDVPLTNIVEFTADGARYCHFSVLGNFRDAKSRDAPVLLRMSNDEIIYAPTFFNCLSPFTAVPLPTAAIIADVYLCSTEILIQLSRSVALYYETNC